MTVTRGPPPGPLQLATARSMSDVRRMLGPTAWCALEVLVAVAEPAGPDGRVVAASVRSVAAELGVSKNTAQRALTVLRRAGLIRLARQHRANGRFDRGSYVLNVPTARPARETVAPHRNATPHRISTLPAKVPTATSEPVEQLSLLSPDH